MARFLTPEWFAMVNDAHLSSDPDVSLVLEQHIIDGPDGEVRYRVAVHGGQVRLAPGVDGDPADVVVTLDYATAVGLATAVVTAQDAFLGGHVRVAGHVERLQAAGPALVALSAGLAQIRERTTY